MMWKILIIAANVKDLNGFIPKATVNKNAVLSANSLYVNALYTVLNLIENIIILIYFSFLNVFL